MIYPFDFHIHTNFCDGKNSAQDIVETAIDKGLCAIGFSSHSYTPFDKDYCMSENDEQEYLAEINALKQKYQDKIKIFCGIEKDYYSNTDTSPFDYVIGSVHYVKKGEKYLSVDLSKDDFIINVNKYYNGDYYAFAKDYYNVLSDVYNKTNCDIIGHFDIITKFNENNLLFDEDDERYKNSALECVDKLIKKDVIFEVNTGAMARGYKTRPYPAEFILKRIIEKGGKICLSSDAHSKDNLCYEFENTIAFLKGLGIKGLQTPKI